MFICYTRPKNFFILYIRHFNAIRVILLGDFSDRACSHLPPNGSLVRARVTRLRRGYQQRWRVLCPDRHCPCSKSAHPCAAPHEGQLTFQMALDSNVRQRKRVQRLVADIL